MTVQHKLEDQSIQAAGLHNSASKISFEQFLLLRVLWLKNKEASELENVAERSRWISENHLNSARGFLTQLPAWQRYIASFGESVKRLRDRGFAGLDAFALARLYQLKIRELNGSSGDTLSIPKLDFTPIARRIRSQTGRQLTLSNLAGQGRPRTPDTPTPALRRSPGLGTDLAYGKGLGLGLTPEAKTEGGAQAEVEDEDEDEATLEAGIKTLSLSNTSSGSSHHISPLSPFTGDFARDLKAISDEQIVNMALLVCLDALTIHYTGLMAEWSPERRAFSVKDQKQLKVYEARVDGHLRHCNRTQEVLAIIETKPFARHLNQDAIQMQEGAQMAAWISQQPPSLSDLEKARTRPGHKFRYGACSFLQPCGFGATASDTSAKEELADIPSAPTYNSRLLISQDRHHIYLTFARFDAEYVAYICDTVAETDGEAQTPSFLEMQEYGPFDTGFASHMRGFGELMLAFCLQSCDDTVEKLRLR